MKTYFSRIECILKEVEVASCTDTVIVFASVGKNWWSATTGRVRKTLDNKRAKIREEVSEGDGWPRDMVWKRERWRCITLSRDFD